MKRASKISASCLIAGAASFIGYAIAANPPKKEARVTQIIRDVQLQPVGATPRPAVQDDQVNENTGVRTGDDSRSELTFDDLTITRWRAVRFFCACPRIPAGPSSERVRSRWALPGPP